jgi:hypothetical protein
MTATRTKHPEATAFNYGSDLRDMQVTIYTSKGTAELSAIENRAMGARYAASLLDRHSGATFDELREMLRDGDYNAAWLEGFNRTAKMILGA